MSLLTPPPSAVKYTIVSLDASVDMYIYYINTYTAHYTISVCDWPAHVYLCVFLSGPLRQTLQA